MDRHEFEDVIERFTAAHTQDVVLIADPTGRIEWISPSVQRLLGWEPDEPQGRLSREFVHPDDLMELADLQARSDAGETVQARIRVSHADGTFTWAEIITERLVDASGAQTGRITAFRDVHAEVTSRRALAESEHWYRLLAENLTDFVTMASPEGLLVWASPSAASAVGWSPDEVYGQPTVSFLHPDDMPRLLELRGQMAEGRASTLRARIQRADGTYRWFDLSIRPVIEDGVLVGRATAYRDVQSEVEAQAALEASERRFRILAEHMADVVVQIDDDTVRWVSPSLTAELGWDVDEWVGHPFSERAHAEDSGLVAAQRRLAVSAPTRVRYRVSGKDGAFHWVDSHAGPYGDADGSSSWVVSFRVIDDLVQTERELDRRARIDAVTGLINRREAFDRLATRDRRSGRATAVLFCDLDRFKDINDERGHLAGDEVLRVVCERVSAAIRRDDIAARIGGDELLVILSGVHDLDEAATIAEGIRSAVATPVELPAGPVIPTLSIGVSLAHPSDDTDALVARADAAMYEAKRSGRNRVVALAEYPVGRPEPTPVDTR